MKNREFFATKIDPELKKWLVDYAHTEGRTIQVTLENILYAAQEKEKGAKK